MFEANVYAVISVLIVSAVSLIGVFTLSLNAATVRKYVFAFVSLAVGALLGDAFIHLIPEAFESIPNTTMVSIAVIGGILIFFVIEKFLHWHHHGEENDIERHAIHPVGKMVLASDGIHNLLDGFIIGVSYLASIEVGIATTVAVILHEIPQEIGDFGILLHSGYTKSRALFLNFLSALLAILGVVIALILGETASSFITWFMPVAAGGFIYIAIADLIPELHKAEKVVRKESLQIIMIIIGVAAMIGLLSLEREEHGEKAVESVAVLTEVQN